MRRQLKLRGSQLAAKPHGNGDGEQEEKSGTPCTSRCDGEHCGSSGPWLEGRWQRPCGAQSSEELRSCSIAKLRAKAREHEAEIHGAVNHLGDDDRQEQEVDATPR